MSKWPMFWQKFFDIFLPRSKEQQLLEEMTAAEFLQRARRNQEEVGKDIMAIWSYKDPLIKSAIWQIKYRNHSKVIRLLAEILYSELLDKLVDLSQFENFTLPILIPIPMSPNRRKIRGYNQTEKLAEEIIRFDSECLFQLLKDVLIKVRETPPQSSLSRTLRLKNLKGSFHVANPEKIRGRNIVLIDDVTTTGATLSEASKTLLRAGARKVTAIVVAH